MIEVNNTIENLYQKYQPFEVLENLWQKYVSTAVAEIQKNTSTEESQPPEKEKPESEKPPVAPPKPLTFAQKYIKNLLENAKSLEGILKDRHLNGLREALEAIDTDDDIDDIMEAIHNAVRTNVYESITKVDLRNIPRLEKYLEDSGYKPIPVKVGDKLADNIDYFECYFKEPTLITRLYNLIKKIDIKPYRIEYKSGEKVKELILKGQCVYYSRKGGQP